MVALCGEEESALAKAGAFLGFRSDGVIGTTEFLLDLLRQQYGVMPLFQFTCTGVRWGFDGGDLHLHVTEDSFFLAVCAVVAYVKELVDKGLLVPSGAIRKGSSNG